MPSDLVHGSVDGALGGLAELLAAQVDQFPRGTGASLCVAVDGEVVADLWAGERAPGVPWTSESGAVVWSVAKGVTAIAVAQMVERGELRLDDSVATYWPEFGANGKSEITVLDVLAHRAGLSSWADYRNVFTFEDPSSWSLENRPRVVADIAGARTVHQSRTAYHAFTFGWILDEVATRATGRDLATLVRERIAEPLGIGLWLADAPVDVVARHVSYGDLESPALLDAFSPTTVIGQAMLLARRGGIVRADVVANSPAFRAAAQPACSLVADARSLCRLYAACGEGGSIDGVTLVDADALARQRAVVSTGLDLVAGRPRRWAAGFALQSGLGESFGLGPNTFGQRGLGGSMACCDPDHHLAFAYVTNAYRYSLDSDPRPLDLADTVLTWIAAT